MPIGPVKTSSHTNSISHKISRKKADVHFFKLVHIMVFLCTSGLTSLKQWTSNLSSNNLHSFWVTLSSKAVFTNKLISISYIIWRKCVCSLHISDLQNQRTSDIKWFQPYFVNMRNIFVKMKWKYRACHINVFYFSFLELNALRD